MKTYDVIVAGGGLTGVAAAVAAARRGCSVLLVEQSGCLGGAMVNCLVYPFMQFWTEVDGKQKLLSDGLFTEMRRRLASYQEPDRLGDFSTECFKFVLDDMTAEAGVEVLYHAALFGVRTEGRNVTALRLATKAGELDVEGRCFVDATGDGDLFAFAGCDFQLGRPKDSLSQPMTTCFRMANVDERYWGGEYARTMQETYKKWQEEGKITNPRENVLTFTGRGMGKGVIHFNTTRIVKHNPTDPLSLSQAETLARKQIWEMVRFLKETNPEGFRDACLVNTAISIGVRESRKLKGDYILTADDLVACRKFDDSIALGNYDIDIHNPEGSGTSHYYFKPGQYYTIPYRSLVASEFDNLLVGGRCISATHEAQASIRIMPICATTGEAAGVAAAVVCKSGATTHNVDVAAIQQLLRAEGAAL